MKIGAHRINLDLVDSTNQYLMALLPTQPIEGTIVMANHQYAGKGQRNANWESNAGENLTFSLLLKPHFLPISKLFYLNKIISLSIVETLLSILEYTFAELNIKWPNDVLINKRKVAGILIENQLLGDKLDACVIGIGLNINQRIFSSKILETACSVIQFTKHQLHLEPILQSLLSNIEKNYELLEQNRWAIIDHYYLDCLFRFQEWADFQRDNEIFKGMIIGVTKDGRLAVLRGQKVEYYDFKEISFVI